MVGVISHLLRDSQPSVPLASGLELRFEVGRSLLLISDMFLVRIECGRIAGDVERIRPVEVGGA